MVGDWQLSSLCVDGLEQMLGNIADQPGCEDFFRGMHIRAMGAFAFGEDGNLTTSGASFTFDVDIVLSTKCARGISGSSAVVVDASVCKSYEDNLTDGSSASIAGASCTFSAGACACSVTSGTMPVDFGNGPYQVQDDQLTLAGETSEFCVAGDVLSIRARSGQLVETLVLERK